MLSKIEIRGKNQIIAWSVSIGILASLLIVLLFVDNYISSKIVLNTNSAANLSQKAEEMDYELTKKDIDKFFDMLSAYQDYPGMINDLFEMAYSFDLSVDNSKYKYTTFKEGALTKVEINFPVEGKYFNVKKFIHELQNSEWFIVIEDLSLVKKNGKKSKELSLDLKLAAYFK